MVLVSSRSSGLLMGGSVIADMLSLNPQVGPLLRDAAC